MNTLRLEQVIDNELSAADLSLIEIRFCLEHFNTAYRSGEALIEDVRYDQEFKAELQKRYPNDPLLSRVEPEPVDAFGSLPKIKHTTPMLSTENAFNGDDIEKFIRRVQKAAAKLGASAPQFKATIKLDGWSGNHVNDILATRGSGTKGTNITHAFDRGLIPIGGTNLGPGEIVVRKDYFNQKLIEDFSNSRNFIAAIINADEVNQAAQLALTAGACHFVPYSVLPCWLGTGDDFLESYTAICGDLENNSRYDYDGVVVEAIDPLLRKALGATTHHHRYMIAVKLKSESSIQTVTDIEWTTGRSGYVTPTAIYEPVFLSGGMLSRALAHNAKRVLDGGIGIGSEIEIVRSSSVIPKIIRTTKKANVVSVPDLCPSCHHDLIWDGPKLRCSNLNCDAQVARTLIHFFKTLGNVDAFGPASINKIINAGYETLEQIYALTEDQYRLIGFGPGESRRFLNQLHRSQTEAIEDYRLLAAMGIESLGRTDSRKLLEVYPLEQLENIQTDDIATIHGFGTITAPVIAKGIAAVWPTLRHLMAMGFTLERTQTNGTMTQTSPIKGMTIVFTGAMQQGSRDQMKKQALALGAKSVQSSISKTTTDILVCGERVGQKKIDAVTKFNNEGASIQVFDEQSYLDLISGTDTSNQVEVFRTNELTIPALAAETTTNCSEEQYSLF